MTAAGVYPLGSRLYYCRDERRKDTGRGYNHLPRTRHRSFAGYRRANPMVYCGFYPVDNADYESFKDALEKLNLNDAALTYEPETSEALGFGFRCGFLGLLHMEIIQERLEREYELALITTAPNVVYQVNLTRGGTIQIENPATMPKPTEIASIEEPFVTAKVIVPHDYVDR